MKSLSIVAVLACTVLSGCVVAPVGPGYYRHRPVVVGPAVVGPPPVVVVRPGYGRGYDRHDHYDRDDRGGRYDRRGRGWRNDD